MGGWGCGKEGLLSTALKGSGLVSALRTPNISQDFRRFTQPPSVSDSGVITWKPQAFAAQFDQGFGFDIFPHGVLKIFCASMCQMNVTSLAGIGISSRTMGTDLSVCFFSCPRRRAWVIWGYIIKIHIHTHTHFAMYCIHTYISIYIHMHTRTLFGQPSKSTKALPMQPPTTTSSAPSFDLSGLWEVRAGLVWV